MNVTSPVVASYEEEKLLKSVAPTVPSEFRASTSSVMPRVGGGQDPVASGHRREARRRCRR